MVVSDTGVSPLDGLRNARLPAAAEKSKLLLCSALVGRALEGDALLVLHEANGNKPGCK